MEPRRALLRAGPGPRSFEELGMCRLLQPAALLAPLFIMGRRCRRRGRWTRPEYEQASLRGPYPRRGSAFKRRTRRRLVSGTGRWWPTSQPAGPASGRGPAAQPHLAPSSAVSEREVHEVAALERVDRFNTRRLLELIGNVSAAEAEAAYYAGLDVTPMAA